MPIVVGHDTAKTRRTLSAGGKTLSYYSIPAAQAAGLGDFSRLPASLKVVLENMLRFEDSGRTVSVEDIKEQCRFIRRSVETKEPRSLPSLLLSLEFRFIFMLFQIDLIEILNYFF